MGNFYYYFSHSQDVFAVIFMLLFCLILSSLKAFLVLPPPRYAASGGLQRIPAALGGAPAVASEVPGEDGVH